MKRFCVFIVLCAVLPDLSAACLSAAVGAQDDRCPKALLAALKMSHSVDLMIIGSRLAQQEELTWESMKKGFDDYLSELTLRRVYLENIGRNLVRLSEAHSPEVTENIQDHIAGLEKSRQRVLQEYQKYWPSMPYMLSVINVPTPTDCGNCIIS